MAKFDGGGENQGRHGPMRPGEQFTFNRKNKDDQPNGTLTIERTGRPYAFDLCDAYNRTMRPELVTQGGEYFVDKQGQVRLGISAEWSAANTKRMVHAQEYERQQWKRHNWRADIDG